MSFLRSRLLAAGAAAACDAFLQAPTLASKRLLDHVHSQIEGQPVFTLLDEQQVAYDLVLQAVAESRRSNTKKVVIVTGGPGTGKSVIAVDVVAALAKQGRNVCHATGSKAFTTTLRKLVGPRAGQLFRYWNVFGDAEPNELDAVIADEAHRLRAVSSNRFTPKHKVSGLPQVDEIVQVARVPVFLLDEHQVVRPEEIGTVAAIRQAAARNRAEVIQVDLNGQFRCAGSAEYVAWVDALLCLDGGRPRPWPPEDPFDLSVVDTPEALQSWVKTHAEAGHTARLSAGFCWPWSDPAADGTLVEDVQIGTWRLPWNAKPGKKPVDAPPAALWATNPRGIDQFDASTPPKGSSTTTAVSSLAPISSGALTTGKPTPHKAVTPLSSGRRTSPSSPSTPTRSCSPEDSSAVLSTRWILRHETSCTPCLGSYHARPLISPDLPIARAVGPVHPIPVALTEPHGLGERWLARRSAVDP